MTVVAGFPPIARDDARVLVLGTMPGVASLAAGAYYAHPRNAFWGIMAVLVGFDVGAPYGERAAALRAAGIALWDVLDACRRPGSLDTAIDPETIVVNDFKGFFAAHPRIGHVFFNGGKAAELFRRHVGGDVLPAGVATLRLPSTSPTNARLRFGDKLAAWRVVETCLKAGEAPPCPRPSMSSPSTSSARSSTGAAP